MSFSRMCRAVLRGSLLVFAITLPLTYFPWTYEPLEVNKQTIAIVLIILAAFAWLGASVAERRVVLRGEWLLGLLFAFVCLPLLASGTYSQPYVSIIGASGQEYTSVITMSLLAMLVFLAPSAWSEARSQVRLWSAMLLVAGCIALTVALSACGVPLPSFIGSANVTALYLLVMSLLGCTLWLTSRGGEHDTLPSGAFGSLVRGSIVLTTLVTLFMLLSIDFTGLWIVALVGTCAMCAFALIRANDFPHLARFLLPMMLLVASLIFLFLPGVFANRFTPEVTVTNHAAWGIATQTLSTRSMLFGSGPGTYAFDYAAFHSADVNTSDFWDVTFDRANSHIMTLLPTYGVLGTALYVIFILGVGVLAIGVLARARSHEEWKLTVAPCIAWLTLTVAQGFLPMNMTLQCVYWLLTAVLLVHSARRLRQYDFAKSPRAGIASAFIFMLLFAGLAVTLFVSVIRYRAEIAFANAVALDKSGGELDAIIALLERATTENRWNDVYSRNLGHAFLLRIGTLINTGAETSLIRNDFDKSFAYARIAVELSPLNVSNWEQLGRVYREASPLFTDDVDREAKEAWERAIELSPNNPKEYLGLARALLTRADGYTPAIQGEDESLADAARIDRDSALAAAETALMKAQSLKADYTPAQYYLAQVYERQDKLADAVKSMETLKANAPLDIGVAMQLGLLYLRQGKNDAAKAELERALTIAPNYANAHWYLATIYEQEDDIAAAIAEVEKIQETDADNALVTQRLERLRAGLASNLIPAPVDEGDTTVTDGDGSTASQTGE